MLILVGSIRPAKVTAARSALESIARVNPRFRDVTVRTVDVTDVAPTMPMTEIAILDGARLRARTILDGVADKRQTDVLGIGMEGGLCPLPGDDKRYVLNTWAAVTDGVRWGFGAGGAIVLPSHIARRVLDGSELGDVIDDIAHAAVRGTRGTWGVLTADLIGRHDSFRAALLAACAPFYNPDVYAGV